MKKFFKLAVAAAVSAATFSTAAQASNTLKDHNVLWHAIKNSGTPIFVNIPSECRGNWGGGSYITFPDTRTVLLVCQDNGQKAGADNQVKWTANDLDTLRHEGHHIVQDCVYGTKGDRWLDPVFTGNQFKEFVTSSLSQDRINFILRSYPAHKHDTELEAFAVAEVVDASAIANAVTKYCK